MRLKSLLAKGIGGASLWTLKHVLGRSASTLPGRIALSVDPSLLDTLSRQSRFGNVVVCGTNGKTTTTNILARAFQQQGLRVACNWAGANMESGALTAFLAEGAPDWGIIECDELSTVHVVPKVKPKVLLLLNLFRDQLDRCGEIDHVQNTIVLALSKSPDTVLIYNEDDPLCKGIALRAATNGTKCISFGLESDVSSRGDSVVDGGFCQMCGEPLVYLSRQYGQLGVYRCQKCDFSRSRPNLFATGARINEQGVSFSIKRDTDDDFGTVSSSSGGSYTVYNLLGAFAAAELSGVSKGAFQRAVDGFNPKNGRLQKFHVQDRLVTLNLAKNPIGFNQNIALMMADTAPKAVYFVINDDYNDGRDISWLWDVDFELLQDCKDLKVFSGGHRANDVQVRFKYAGIESPIAESVSDVIQASRELPDSWHIWVLTNYSALWPVKDQLEKLEGLR